MTLYPCIICHQPTLDALCFECKPAQKPKGDVCVTPYAAGVISRGNEYAFLSNPFVRQSKDWNDWRSGWLACDVHLTSDCPVVPFVRRSIAGHAAHGNISVTVS